MATEIRLTDNGFQLKDGWWNRQTVSWPEIKAVSAVNLHKVTYDEVFLTFRLKGGRTVSIGELDTNFRALEHALFAHLDGFDADWYTAAEEQDGRTVDVWHRPAA